jgi:DNA-binding beta-propeller fold protein YncE
MMRMLPKFMLLSMLGLLGLPGVADAAELRQIGTIAIPGEPLNSFDISYIDQVSGLYFLADRSNKGVDIVDTRKGVFVGRVEGMVGFSGKNDTSGPNGVVAVNRCWPENTSRCLEVWAGDGDSTVKVIDLKTMKIVDTISTGGKARADEIAWDPEDQIIAIANNADEPPFLTFISTRPGHKILGKVVMEHATDGMEQTQYSPADRMFYTDIPELDKDKTKGALAVTNPKTLKVVRMIPVDNCAPHGLAVGRKRMLFLGCNAGNPRLGLPAQLVVVDSKAGKVAATIPDVGGSDESAVNLKINQYYSALNGNPGGPILAVVDGKTNKLLQKVPTGPGAHSVAASDQNDRVYVPIAAMGGGCGCITVYGSN